MRAEATFTVRNFEHTEIKQIPAIRTGLPVGVSTMEKIYTGQISGRSATIFTSAFDITSGRGSYVAMESYEGTLHGQEGSFNFIHSAATRGQDRTDEFFSIVVGSGTGKLEGIAGSGGLIVHEDGSHHIWLEYVIGA